MRKALLGLGILLIAGLTALAVIVIARPRTPAASTAVANNPSPAASVALITATDSMTISARNNAPTPPPTLRSARPSRTAPPSPSSTSSDTARRAGVRHAVPALPAAAQFDPLAVATAYVQTLATIDTVFDVDRTDAAGRAAYLMTPALTAQTTRHPTTGTDTQWQSWLAEKAYTTVSTVRINIPWAVADSKVSATRAIGYVVAVHTADGSSTSQPQHTLAVTMIRANERDPWRVNATEIP